jgi:hypothetical protein
MKKILPVVAILTACGPSSSNHVDAPTPSDRPVNPRPAPSPTPTIKPMPNQRLQYMPSWASPEWSDLSYFITGGEPGNYGILPGEEPIADSMFRYFEAIRANWTQTINHGVIPEDYLARVPSGFENIMWTDSTGGQIKGFEKLQATLQEMQSRCPQIALPTFQAPLEVVWATDKDTPFPGRFLPNSVALRWEKNRVSFSANNNVRPRMLIRAEWVKTYPSGHWDGWKWPNQTFKEQTGGRSWADGGFTSFSVDETFAHEYGHFVLQAWALNNGRSNLQSQWFAEGFAELFKLVCWGGLQDRPDWVSMNARRLNDPFNFSLLLQTYKTADHRFSYSSEYMLDSLGELITWKQDRREFKAEEFFEAMLKTLEQMEGRIIRDYPVVSPVDGVLTDTAPWTNASSFMFPEIKNDAPRMFTRQEFLEKFCDNYECGDMKELLKADAEGLQRDEW